MTKEIRVFIEFALVGKIEAFEAIFKDIIALGANEGSDLRYDFFRHPTDAGRIFALERHRDAQSLAHHFERAFPLMQMAWACARPVQTIILGDLPAPLRKKMEENGVTVAPRWMSN